MVKEEKIDENPFTDVFFVNNVIVKYYHDKKKELPLLKATKLVYLCFGAISSFKRRYLFAEEIQAWRLGPVVPALYYPLRKTVDKMTYFTTEESYKLKSINNVDDNDIKEPKELIEKICFEFLDSTAKKMVDITHLKGSP